MINYDTESLLEENHKTHKRGHSHGILITSDLKEKWMANKVKLERKITNINKNHETLNKIIGLISDRNKPEPDYKYRLIK